MAGKITAFILAAVLGLSPRVLADSEVLPDSGSRVVLREHPATLKPYVVITDRPDKTETPGRLSSNRRPDYRMLDPRVKSGDIPYDGPVSSRKKVYLFAAGLAATGIVSSAALPVAAVTGAGASAGAGGYGAAGGAVAAGTLSTALLKSQPDPRNNFTLESGSRVIKASSDSEKIPFEDSNEERTNTEKE